MMLVYTPGSMQDGAAVAVGGPFSSTNHEGLWSWTRPVSACRRVFFRSSKVLIRCASGILTPFKAREAL